MSDSTRASPSPLTTLFKVFIIITTQSLSASFGATHMLTISARAATPVQCCIPVRRPLAELSKPAQTCGLTLEFSQLLGTFQTRSRAPCPCVSSSWTSLSRSVACRQTCAVLDRARVCGRLFLVAVGVGCSGGYVVCALYVASVVLAVLQRLLCSWAGLIERVAHVRNLKPSCCCRQRRKTMFRSWQV